MLIFDNFKSTERANDFLQRIYGQFRLRGTICLSEAESNAIDPFPFPLETPIVLIPRTNGDNERLIEHAAIEFGGTFAGT